MKVFHTTLIMYAFFPKNTNTIIHFFVMIIHKIIFSFNQAISRICLF